MPKHQEKTKPNNVSCLLSEGVGWFYFKIVVFSLYSQGATRDSGGRMEKCYDPRDKTLRFVEREDELDCK